MKFMSGFAAIAAATLSFSSTLAQQIVVDGAVADWPVGQMVTADNEFLYVQLRFDEPLSLSQPGFDLTLAIDGDLNDRTGSTDTADRGAELTIGFGVVEDRGGWTGPGLVTTVHDADGTARRVPAFEFGVHAAPTHASDIFELRIRRDNPALKINDNGPIEVTLRSSESGAPVASKTTINLGSRARTIARDESVPAKLEGAIRVLSWNVLWGGQLEDPAAHARVIKAINPDVILFQEWDRGESTRDDIAEWLNTNAPSPHNNSAPWMAQAGPAWGVAVATPWNVSLLGPDGITADNTAWDFPVRLASAAIDTPAGTVVFGSIHYKCCGAINTREDARRLGEAAAVRESLRQLAQSAGTTNVVLGGDFNLNGLNQVLFESVTGLDTDGTPLAIAQPAVLNDSALYTFGRPGQDSLRPRLDFITYPDASFTAVNAFVLESSRLSTRALREAGLQTNDSHASDHLPVVVDLMPKN
ncbi:MAG: endonuclease/exonuclease/phosphatase family protein [Planctomycetota bacterium]